MIRHSANSLRLTVVLTLTCVTASASAASAATLVQLQLVPDGSSQPPGDVISLRVRLEPQERDIQIRVRAFLVKGGRQTRVLGKSTIPTKDGQFEIRSRPKEPIRDRLATVSVVVPYSN